MAHLGCQFERDLHFAPKIFERADGAAQSSETILRSSKAITIVNAILAGFALGQYPG